jgi:TolB protein
VSPDGRQIAFTSTRDGPLDLYVMDVSGANTRRLTTSLHTQAQPSWSPDGRRLLFSAAPNGVADVYVVNVDGTGLRRLTRGEDGVR